jgi:hypothetical protein
MNEPTRSQSASGPRRPPTARDLLTRGPLLAEPADGAVGLSEIVDQLEELAALLRRGLLSRAELERQKRRILRS